MTGPLITEVPDVEQSRIVITDEHDESVFYDPPTQPWQPDRQLVDQATGHPITLHLSVEGLGGINDYSLHVELPAYDDHVQLVAHVLATITQMIFSLTSPRDE
jgi:hypothetical protein